MWSTIFLLRILKYFIYFCVNQKYNIPVSKLICYILCHIYRYMSTVSSQFEQAVEQGKNAARRGEPLMTRAALKEYVTPDIIDPLTSAYMNAIRQSGGQRGGAYRLRRGG